jgi:hypothetical protein
MFSMTWYYDTLCFQPMRVKIGGYALFYIRHPYPEKPTPDLLIPINHIKSRKTRGPLRQKKP